MPLDEPYGYGPPFSSTSARLHTTTHHYQRTQSPSASSLSSGNVATKLQAAHHPAIHAVPASSSSTSHHYRHYGSMDRLLERYSPSAPPMPVSERYPLGERPQASITTHMGDASPPPPHLSRPYTRYTHYEPRTLSSSYAYPPAKRKPSPQQQQQQQPHYRQQLFSSHASPTPSTSYHHLVEPPSPAPEGGPECFPGTAFLSPIEPTRKPARYKLPYIPPAAHVPVERYVPAHDYHSTSNATIAMHTPYEQQRYLRHYTPPPRPPYAQISSYHHQQVPPMSMRRYHVVPPPTATSTTARFTKCCHHSSASSSSSSSPTTPATAYCPPAVVYHVAPGKCRSSLCHSTSVEYVGPSGGRHVCQTPPPPKEQQLSTPLVVEVPRDTNSSSSSVCCSRRNTIQGPITAPVVQTSSAWKGMATSQPPRCSATTSPTTTSTAPSVTHATTSSIAETQAVPTPQVQRAVSLPASSQTSAAAPASTVAVSREHSQVQYSHSDRVRGSRTSKKERRPKESTETTADAATLTRKQLIKNYLRKETANFFGVAEDNEEEQRNRWLDRRKRMAIRSWGPLRSDYDSVPTTPAITSSTLSMRQRELPPDVLPSDTDVIDHMPTHGPDERDIDELVLDEHVRGAELRRKDSVARMTWNGLSYVINTLTSHAGRRRSQASRENEYSRSFTTSTTASHSVDGNAEPDDQQHAVALSLDGSATTPLFFQRTELVTGPGGDTIDHQHSSSYKQQQQQQQQPQQQHYRHVLSPTISTGWRRRPQQIAPPPPSTSSGTPTINHQIGHTRIGTQMLDRMLDNSNRRQFGMGWVGRIFGRSLNRTIVERDAKLRQQLNDLEDYRPMFTYWVSTVQILVLFISIFCYGFGPIGLDMKSRSSQVLVTSLSLQQEEYLEPANFWLGPRPGDLIHLGAKFTPCMRIDEKINQEIEKIHAKERETACCIRNDDSGCVQLPQGECSNLTSIWKKRSFSEVGPGGRISGSVCGLDPKFCDAPASVHPFEWPDDITKWPICRKTNTQSPVQRHRYGNNEPNSRNGGRGTGWSSSVGTGNGGNAVGGSGNGGGGGGGAGGGTMVPRDKIAEHMVCEVIGHPCCIGIHGQCRITTREYCDFVYGTFHEEASLCSQVYCLNDVCGMLPFYFPEMPDQFYRLWTSLFMHAGIVHLAITILIQYCLMRDLEKLIGSLRIGIIYMGSGVAGNLASAIFVPYRADVGPAGAQFGLLACLMVEVLNAWPMLRHPRQALGRLAAITAALFVVGLLPWVDNYAHLFGFVFGFLLSYALMPYVTFGRGPYERSRKVALIWMCLTVVGVLMLLLVLLFYIIPVYDCRICSYFNCVPLTPNFCASQNINFKRDQAEVG